MQALFEITSYRKYLSQWIASQTDGGYGMKGKIAAALGVSSSLVSQILKGEKTLNSDQASDLADFLGLSGLESDYFHLLVESERAGNPRYREKLARKMNAIRAQSRLVGNRVPRTKELTEEQKAIFYSSWLYTGIRNLTAVPGFDQANTIAEHLHLEPVVVHRVLKFLIENGLCKETDGKLTYGPASTHVDQDSPYVNKHHQNWRFQAIQKMENRKSNDLFFTSPMSLSTKGFEEIRTLLPTVIQNVMKVSGPSPSEMTSCLNIDWFEY